MSEILTNDGFTFGETEVNALKTKVNSLESRLAIAKEALEYYRQFELPIGSYDIATKALSKLNEEK